MLSTHATLTLRLVAASSLALALACGGSQGPNINVQSMPAGGSYNGVFMSPQYGEMHLCQTGTSVVGRYFKDERTGSIQGSLTGNVLRFRWEESRELVAGRPVRTEGRGYFELSIQADGDTYLRGEWGIDNEMAGGGAWEAVKMRRGEPERCQGGAAER